MVDWPIIDAQKNNRIKETYSKLIGLPVNGDKILDSKEVAPLAKANKNFSSLSATEQVNIIDRIKAYTPDGVSMAVDTYFYEKQMLIVMKGLSSEEAEEVLSKTIITVKPADKFYDNPPESRFDVTIDSGITGVGEITLRNMNEGSLLAAVWTNMSGPLDFMIQNCGFQQNTNENEIPGVEKFFQYFPSMTGIDFKNFQMILDAYRGIYEAVKPKEKTQDEIMQEKAIEKKQQEARLQKKKQYEILAEKNMIKKEIMNKIIERNIELSSQEIVRIEKMADIFIDKIVMPQLGQTLGNSNDVLSARDAMLKFLTTRYFAQQQIRDAGVKEVLMKAEVKSA